MDKNNYAILATNDAIEIASKSLSENGFKVIIADNSKNAVKKALELIPEGAEIMTATSQTLTQLGLDTTLNESGKYNSVMQQLAKMNSATDGLQMQKLGAAPEFVIGSVHAVTQDGKVIIVSNTGSQLPAYSYGATHVIWIVSTKKITKNLDDGINRVYQYVLPLESVRVQKAYGMAKSEVKKMLIINKELDPDRITIILVKEDLGF